jgi:hypothetical protein
MPTRSVLRHTCQYQQEQTWEQRRFRSGSPTYITYCTPQVSFCGRLPIEGVRQESSCKMDSFFVSVGFDSIVCRTKSIELEVLLCS